jgi:hypothetical protein
VVVVDVRRLFAWTHALRDLYTHSNVYPASCNSENPSQRFECHLGTPLLVQRRVYITSWPMNLRCGRSERNFQASHVTAIFSVERARARLPYLFCGWCYQSWKLRGSSSAPFHTTYIIEDFAPPRSFAHVPMCYPIEAGHSLVSDVQAHAFSHAYPAQAVMRHPHHTSQQRVPALA